MEVTQTQATPQAPVTKTDAPTQTQSAPEPVNMDHLSGAEASALVERAKVSGKSVEDQFRDEQKSGKSAETRGPDGKFLAKQAPKEESTQESLKEAAAEAKRRMKIGEEEVDEDEVIRIYKERKGHQRAANEELQKGKAYRRQAEQLINMMKDPEAAFEILSKLGHDARALAEKHLVRQLEEENMDPRERELRDTKKKIQHYEDLEQKKIQAAEAARHQELTKKYTEEYNSTFPKAAQEHGLPATKETIGRMAAYIHKAAKFSSFKMTPSEAAQLVRQDIEKAQQTVFANADGQALLKLLGDEGAKKLLMARGQQVKQTGYSTPTEQPNRREIASSKSGRMTQQEWRRYNRSK